MAKLTYDKFYDFLFERTPDWDAKIVEDIRRKPWIEPLPIDVRLLPNLMRRVHVAHGASQQKLAKRLRISVGRFRRLREQAYDLLRVRLKVWLRRLPKNRRKHERALRLNNNGWIGQIELGAYPTPTRLSDFPVLTQP
jgi:hypothetical protein